MVKVKILERFDFKDDDRVYFSRLKYVIKREKNQFFTLHSYISHTDSKGNVESVLTDKIVLHLIASKRLANYINEWFANI